MPAILFGSISTVADTSELQREAFNQAFATHGLDWTWDRDSYLEMLGSSGGAGRIAQYARSRGEQVDAAAVHATKSENFRRNLRQAGVSPRTGVAETIEAARSNGVKIGLVTTTSAENVAALIDSLEPTLTRGDFDVVVDVTSVEQPKPDKAAYAFALDRLGETADACIAIEDNVGGVQAADAAGLTCVAFPNENTAGHDFGPTHPRVDRLEFDELRLLTPSH